MSARSFGRPALVPQEHLTAEKRHHLASTRRHQSIAPGVVPADTSDGAHHVNLHWLDSHLEDAIGCHDVSRLQVGDRKSERLDRVENSRSVLNGRANEHVEIASKAGRAVKGERVRSDNHEFNVVGDE